MALAGLKIGILVEFNYEDLELQYPLLRFREEGATTFTIGPTKGTKYTGKHGYPAVSDKSIDEVKASELDALIVPGGWAPDYWRRDKRFTGLVSELDQQGKIIGFICHAGWLLVSAKVLKGRTVTCFVAIKDDMENAGARYVDEEVVVDRNFVSSRTPQDLPAFCKAIIQQLLKTKQAAL